MTLGEIIIKQARITKRLVNKKNWQRFLGTTLKILAQYENNAREGPKLIP